tara:strand:- start:13 stop:120 length:108 start_codon:yes stop_codon:yes gene_type:complete
LNKKKAEEVSFDFVEEVSDVKISLPSSSDIFETVS